MYSSVSLRYDTPISGQAAYGAKRYSVEHSEEKTFWPVFWSEYTASVTGGVVTTNTDCIRYSGDQDLVWPAEYITGAAPGVIDAAGCAVSEELAWRLWGSTDVVGMPITIDEEERVVRGVFKGRTELALIPYTQEDTTVSWSCVELSGDRKDAARGDAEAYALASGLGRPDFILMGGPAFISLIMTVLPLIAPAVYALAALFGHMRKRYPWLSKPVLYSVLIVFAALTPVFLKFLPAWLIPTRWSDFSYWSFLLRSAGSGLREFLSVTPRLRDVGVRMLLLKQAGFTFLAVCCGISACFRWHIHYQ